MLRVSLMGCRTQLNASIPFPSLEWTLPEPLAVCSFEDGDLCGWKNDANSWQNEWTLERSSLCLSAKVPSRQTDGSKKKKTSSWIQSIPGSSSSSASVDVNARLWSPPVPAVLGMKCLTFVYTIKQGEAKSLSGVKRPAGLSLLQRQEGY